MFNIKQILFDLGEDKDFLVLRKYETLKEC